MKTFHLHTLGCKVNESDSDLVRTNLLASGWEEVSPENAEVILVNSCYVTREAGRKSRKTARKFKRKNPAARVVLFGCYGVVKPDISGVEVVSGGPTAVLKHLGVEVSEPHPRNVRRARYFLKIEDGCSMKCSYCIIRELRGPVRSKPVEHVLTEARHAYEEGHGEIVLVGVNLNLYDGGTTLLQLLRLLNKEFYREDVRFRLSSLNPALVERDFVEEVLSLPKFAPHFHFSFQHVSDRILRLMKRGYGTDKVFELIETVSKAKPSCGLTADFIVGFWGENEKEFEKLLDFLKKPTFDRVHIFPYSEHNGLAVEGEELVPYEERKVRARVALKVAKTSTMMRGARRFGEVHRVLVEKKWERGTYGHSEYYNEVLVKGPCESRFVDVCIIGIERNWGYLLGEVKR